MRSLLAYVKPTLKMCRRLLQRLTDEKKDLKGATRLMSCLPAMGLQPNFAMYKSMVRSAALAGHSASSVRWPIEAANS
ncbi:unnamed protein product [Effrenium voratum]|nr:unnamed protein product [Effrenium voratum]